MSKSQSHHASRRRTDRPGARAKRRRELRLEDELWSAQVRAFGQGHDAAVIWVRRGRRLLALHGSPLEVMSAMPRRAGDGTTAYVTAADGDRMTLLGWLTHVASRVVEARSAEPVESSRSCA